LTSTAESRPDFKFKPVPNTDSGQIRLPNSFLMGTNAKNSHLEEALRQQIILQDEHVLGFFDGIFFEADGKRVGGLALHDYMIVTDRHLTMWARDQFKDYVDRFSLSQVYLKSSEQKDYLHGQIKFGFELPHETEDALDSLEQIEITFDLVPVPDLKQITNLIEVMSSLHRDLIEGGAGEEDRWKASLVLFEQLFVMPLQAAPTAPKAEPRAGYGEETEDEPLVEIVEEDAAEDLMTPLSRLNRLDNPNHTRPLPGEIRPKPLIKPASLPASNTYGAADSGGSLEDLAAELKWLSENQANSSGLPNPPAIKLSPRRMPPSTPPGSPEQVSPVTRLKQDLSPESLYNIGRAGRVVWDGLDRLKREGEAKFEAKGRPTLQALKDNGMNIKDITELLTAVNSLLDTVNRSPAARELALTFLNRSAVGTSLGLRKTRPPVDIEDVADDGTPLKPGTAKSERVKVERRSSNKMDTETDPSSAQLQKVSIRKRSGEIEASDTPVPGTSPAPEILEEPLDLTSKAEIAPPVQARLPRKRLVPVRAANPRPEVLDN
jgi:hypothetical protein